MKVFPITQSFILCFYFVVNAHLAMSLDVIQRDMLGFVLENTVDAFLPSQSVGRIHSLPEDIHQYE